MAETLGASFKIDVSQLSAGLRQANKLIRESESEFKKAAAGMDNWSKSEDGIKAKIQQLNTTTQVQREKVRALKEEYNRLIAEGMDPTSQKAVELRTKINQEEAALAKNEKELEEQKKALSELSEEEEKASLNFEKFGQVVAKAAKVAAAALAAVTAATIAIGKSAIDAYADYEQLAGGVEQLFGKEAGARLMKYANEAYRTAGLSANQYLEQATSFSAKLITELGGDAVKAADISNKAMIQMADNANTFGTDLQSIQNAYQGFARGQYMMLDNLKLGYSGTGEEMKRLLADAEALTGIHYDIENFSDIVEAIQVIQDKLKVTGKTAEEAASTISGSMGMLKASWQNMLVAIADGGDWDSAVNGMVESVDAVIENLFPRIIATLEGMGKALDQLAPILMEKIPPAINSVLPALVTGIAKLFAVLLATIVSGIPTLLKAGSDIMSALADGITSGIENIKGASDGAIHAFILNLGSNLSKFIESGIKLIVALVQGLAEAMPMLMQYVPILIETLVNVIIENLPLLIEAGIQLVLALVKGLLQSLPSLLSAMGSLAKGAAKIITSFSWLKVGKDIIQKFINGVKSMVGNVTSTAKQIPKAVKDGIGSLITDAKTWGSDMVKNFIDGITGKMSGLLDKVKGMANDIKGYLHFSVPDKGPLKDADTWMPDMMQLFSDGIEKNKYKVVDSVRGLAHNINSSMKSTSLVSDSDGRTSGAGGVVVYQTNNYAQTHTRYEIYKSKQQTAAAVRLALKGV